MKKTIGLLLACVMLVSALPAPVTAAQEIKTEKNVILLIPDGQSVGGTTLARWYKGGSLALDEMACGLVRTYSADSAIADSAPAATAMATGFKSRTGYIGVLGEQYSMPGLSQIAPGDEKRPVANVLEAAQLQGKATGIIATSEIMHATPAAFSSHGPSRKDYDSLCEQQVYQEIDVVLGSGSKFFAEARKDGEDLIAEIKALGYQYATTRSEMNAVSSGKLWGMFAPADLAYEFDRDQSTQPSLAEMTRKSIELLSQDKDGFFLMVEGSKIDWAAHANDPIGVISDTLAFDDAVAEALRFAKQDGNTVVIAATDHGNGGITIGDSGTSGSYDKLHIDNYLNPLKKATLTGEGIEKKLNADRSNITEVMSRYYGIDDLTAEEIAAIRETPAGSMNYTVGPMISKRANIGWTTTGHTGEDVPLYIYAPNGLGITGVYENSDLATYMETVLGLDLSGATDRLFVPVRQAAEEKGAQVAWNTSDAKNPVIELTKGGVKVELPVNKNYALVNGEKVTLDGVTVYNGVKTFAPLAAISLLP